MWLNFRCADSITEVGNACRLSSQRRFGEPAERPHSGIGGCEREKQSKRFGASIYDVSIRQDMGPDLVRLVNHVWLVYRVSYTRSLISISMNTTHIQTLKKKKVVSRPCIGD
jgi:hypothetical protein